MKRELIKALRTGAAPGRGFEDILVGVEAECRELLEDLRRTAEVSGASVRFVSGEYGSGKTMLTGYIQTAALRERFVVAHVVIDPGLSLGSFLDVYSAICRQLRTASENSGSGLTEILEAWSLKQFRSFVSIEGLDDRAPLTPAQFKSFGAYLETELATVRNIDSAFARAVSAFAVAKLSKNTDLARHAIAWLRGGDNVASRDYMRELGLKGSVDHKDAYNFLHGLFLLVREAGYNGALIVLDEVETVRRLPNKAARQKAYETLRHIIDDAADGRFQNALFLATVTPEFFSSKQYGVAEYPALQDRISTPIKADGASLKQPVIQLKPLEYPQLLLLAQKIRNLHGEAEVWDAARACDDGELALLTRCLAQSFGGETKSGPRQFLREIINVFDLLRENPGKSVRALVPSMDQFDER